MGRVFFPTYRANIIGVRDVGPYPQLGGMDGTIVVPRAPAEPYPRAANNPTQKMLGAFGPMIDDGSASQMIRVGPFGYPISRGGPIFVNQGPYSPANPPVFHAPPTPLLPANPLPGPTISPTPVSQQTGPTPTVTLPPTPQPGTILVSSSGGVPVPATAPVTAPVTISTGTSDTSAIASWLSGSTMIFTYNVPNALLAGVVVLGFALLSGGGKKGR